MKRLNENDAALTRFLKASYGYTQEQIAADLTHFGYVSSTGLPLTASHVSNFCNDKLGLGRVKQYEKKNYKGKNWRKFAKQAE